MCHQCPNFGQVLLSERETWEAQHVESAQFHPCTKRSYRNAVQNGRWYCDVSLVEAFVYLHVSAWNVVFPIDHVDASRCKDISPRPVFVSSWFRKSGSCTEPSLALCPRKKLLKTCQLRLSRWTLCILRMVTFDNLNWWLLRVEVADRERQGRELCKSRRNCIPQLGAEEPIWRALFLSQVISFPRRWPFVALNWCQADFVVTQCQITTCTCSPDDLLLFWPSGSKTTIILPRSAEIYTPQWTPNFLFRNLFQKHFPIQYMLLAQIPFGKGMQKTPEKTTLK